MKVVKREDRIRAVDGVAVFVVHDEPALIRDTMLEGVDVTFPVLVDRDRRSYDDWGMRRASFSDIWLDPNLYRQYARLLLGGERLRSRGEDPRQLGGDFVVGPDGHLVYARPQERDDRPPVGELVEHLGRSVAR